MKNYFVHKNAIVETKNIGEGSRIWAFVHILPEAIIGKSANICDHCFIENKVIIGDNVTIKCGVYLWDGITIEDSVMIGPAAAFTNDRYPRSKNINYKQEEIFLRKGSSIGANATILAGVTVGEYALVGAGSVVTTDVPSYALVYGNPANIRGWVCECGNKLPNEFNETTCQKCKRKYAKKGQKVTQK